MDWTQILLAIVVSSILLIAGILIGRSSPSERARKRIEYAAEMKFKKRSTEAVYLEIVSTLNGKWSCEGLSKPTPGFAIITNAKHSIQIPNLADMNISDDSVNVHVEIDSEGTLTQRIIPDELS